MKVTKLKPSARRPGFVSVFVDGARFALLPVEEVRALGLEKDLVLDERRREMLETAAQRSRAYDAAVRLLAVRGRSVQEVIRRLRRKGIRADAVDHAVGRLESEGLLDDAAFAREFARLRQGRGYGPAWLLAALSRRGVERHAAERAVAELEGDSRERDDRLLALARRRAERMRSLVPDVARRRLVGYLQRRGYSVERVLSVLERLAGEQSSHPGREEACTGGSGRPRR